MILEARVFDGHDGLAQHLGNLIGGDHLAPFGRKFADAGAVTAQHTGDRAGRVFIERGDLREVAHKREHHAARNAEKCRRHEQGDKAHAPDQTDGDNGHSFDSTVGGSSRAH